MAKVKKKRRANKVVRKKNGQIIKGQILNPHGRPKLPEVMLLREALVAVGKKKKKSFYTLVAEKAYDDNSVLIAVLRKFAPDLKSIEGIFGTLESSMSDATALTIQKKLKDRFSV